MKKVFLCLCAILTVTVLFAQDLKPIAEKINVRKLQNETFNRVNLFEITGNAAQRNAQLKNTVGNSTVMEFHKTDAQTILQSKPKNILFTIPSTSGNIELELFKTNLFTPDFSVVTSGSGDRPASYDQGVHYWGIIKGDNTSLAAISIFGDEVMGMISSSAKGNLVLGKLENDSQGRHVLYNERELKTQPKIECFTNDDRGNYSQSDLGYRVTASTNCIRLYWEANYDLYLNKGSSVTNVTSYLTGLFNQSAVLYSNDSIPVTLSEIYVWTTASPYTATTTSSLLSQFQSFRNSFNGDLGHLIGLAGGGGIAAGFSGFCNSNMDNRQCYSGINSSFNNVPTFSWSVEVVTHEQGHLMGSRHTHACVWNGNNTAIDNCGPTAGYAYEGSCSGAPTPVNGGTIMSYCHLVGGVGINFTNGFGTQPRNVILNRFNNALCLTACSGSSCSAPTGMSTTSITTSSATFNWTIVSGASSYAVQYRIVGTSTWSMGTASSNSFNAPGLSPGSNYEWQVQTVCSGGSSSFTSSTLFTTLTPPCNAPTGMNTTSVTTSSATFNWTAVSGAISYTIRYRVVGTSTWSTGTSGVNSFNVFGLSPGSNYEWQVQTVCSGGSSSFTSSTLFTTSVAPCNAPTGMNTTAVTSSSATFNWTAVPGALSYAIQFRVVGTSTWSTGTSGINSFNASGLSSGTNYEWQVQTVCSGGSSSFTSSTLFTTTVPPCNAPTGMNTTGVTTSSATFNWTAVSGALSYNVRFRITGTTTWSNGTTGANSFNASGLSSGSVYEWQVQTVCTGGSSSFTSSTIFTTVSTGCVDVYESNNSKTAAVSIPFGTDIFGLINPVNDLDFFKFNNTTAQPKIKITLTNLPADYDVSLYQNNSNNASAVSMVRGSGSETVIFNTNTIGTWKIKVNGYNGAFDPSRCYTLRIELSGTPFSLVGGRESSGIEDLEKTHLNLYPNPAQDRLNIEFSSGKVSQALITVYNIIGNKVMFSQDAVSEGVNVIDMNTALLPNGIYILEMVNNGEIIRQKFSIAK